MSNFLDRRDSTNIHKEIEQRYYAKINELAAGNRLLNDPEIIAAPNNHIGLFSDHAIVHARDPAIQVAGVLPNRHGMLILWRDARRFSLMQG